LFEIIINIVITKKKFIVRANFAITTNAKLLSRMAGANQKEYYYNDVIIVVARNFLLISRTIIKN
jgi:hypothetical protein